MILGQTFRMISARVPHPPMMSLLRIKQKNAKIVWLNSKQEHKVSIYVRHARAAPHEKNDTIPICRA